MDRRVHRVPQGKSQDLNQSAAPGQFILLDRPGRIDPFRAGLGAFADERALPDAVVRRANLHAFLRRLVARVIVVSLGQRDGRGTDEARLQSINRAGGIAQHTVDAGAELLVDIQLVAVFAGTLPGRAAALPFE